MECCICYESSGIYNTECSHNLCLDCLLELKKLECPICRNQLNKIPVKIKKLIENNNEQYGLIININNISNNVLLIINQIRNISRYQYNIIVDNINNGQIYQEEYLKDLLEELTREQRNIYRITNSYWYDMDSF